MNEVPVAVLEQVRGHVQEQVVVASGFVTEVIVHVSVVTLVVVIVVVVSVVELLLLLPLLLTVE